MKHFFAFFIAIFLSEPVLSKPFTVPVDNWNRVEIQIPESSESLINPHTRQWESLSTYRENSRVRKLSRTVGRLKVEFIDNLDKQVLLCTAFLVGNDIALTNSHCLPSQKKITRIKLEMGYYGPESKLIEFPVLISPIARDNFLDVALVKTMGSPEKKFGKLMLSKASISENDDLFIVHHPEGAPKKISRLNCHAGKPDQVTEYFQHKCDTLPGSSGAPVFSFDGSLVGIHHRGTKENGAQAFNLGTRLAELKLVNPPFSSDHSQNAEEPTVVDQNALQSGLKLEVRGVLNSSDVSSLPQLDDSVTDKFGYSVVEPYDGRIFFGSVDRIDVDGFFLLRDYQKNPALEAIADGVTFWRWRGMVKFPNVGKGLLHAKFHGDDSVCTAAISVSDAEVLRFGARKFSGIRGEAEENRIEIDVPEGQQILPIEAIVSCHAEYGKGQSSPLGVRSHKKNGFTMSVFFPEISKSHVFKKGDYFH